MSRTARAGKAAEESGEGDASRELEELRARVAELSKAAAELEQARATAQSSAEFYRDLFENSPDAITLFDPESRLILDFNTRAHESLGYTREEFRKLELSDVEACESPEEIADHALRVCDEGSDTFETKHRAKDGELRDVLVLARVASVGTGTALKHIFDPFCTTRLMEGGTGLGLSVAHGIVADHKGQLSIESEPGRGTALVIELPLSAET